MNAPSPFKLIASIEAGIESIARRPLVLLLFYSALYWVVTLPLAAQKPMWADELCMFYMCEFPSMSDVWPTWMTGAEKTPPLYHLVARAITTTFGLSALTIRLPTLIGFWLMGVCLYLFVAKRVSGLFAWVAMLFPMVSGAYYWAYEARPYGWLLGLGSVGLICWQAASDGRYRKLALAGLCLSLAAAVTSHYYAVLLFVPLGIGEVVRSIRRRRVDLPIWAALVLALSPVFVMLPLIMKVAQFSGTYWTKFGWINALKFYRMLLEPVTLPLGATLVAAVLLPAEWLGRGDRPSSQTDRGPGIHELAAALGLAAVPLMAIALAKLATGAFTSRYGLPAVIGLSILMAFAAWRLLGRMTILAAVLVLLMCAHFLVNGAQQYKSMSEQRRQQDRAVAFLESAGRGDLPIVVSDSHTFLMLAHYGSPTIASRIVYLADPDASYRHLRHDSVEHLALDMYRDCFDLAVEEYDSYLAIHREFRVYGSPAHPLNWLHSELVDGPVHIELMGRHRDAVLLLVRQADRSTNDDPQN